GIDSDDEFDVICEHGGGCPPKCGWPSGVGPGEKGHPTLAALCGGTPNGGQASDQAKQGEPRAGTNSARPDKSWAEHLCRVGTPSCHGRARLAPPSILTAPHLRRRHLHPTKPTGFAGTPDLRALSRVLRIRSFTCSAAPCIWVTWPPNPSWRSPPALLGTRSLLT